MKRVSELETLRAELAATRAELADARREQAATAGVLKVIGRSAFDLAAVLNTLIGSARTLCDADIGSICLREGDYFPAHATAGVDAAFLAALRAKPQHINDRSLTPRVARTGRTEHIPDQRLDPDYEAPEGTSSVARPRTLLGVPLFREGQVQGVFVLMRMAHRPFARKDIELAESFADQAVVAIENTRLFNETREALERQTATADILRVIASSPSDTQPVFESIVLTAVRLLGCSVAAVLLRDGGAFESVAAATPKGLHTPKTSRMPIDPTANFPSRAIVSKETLYLPDWSLIDLPEQERKVRELFGANCSLFLPLLRKGECFALLTLVAQRANAFGPSEITQAESFRDQALIAIENARLFAEVTAKTRDLEEALAQQTATADVLKVISRSAFDLRAVLDTLIASAIGLCEASRGVIWMRKGDVLRRAAHVNYPEDWAWTVGDVPIAPAPDATSASGIAAFTGEIINVEDMLSDPRFGELTARRLGGYRGVLAVPMERDGVVVGVISLARPEARRFTDRQVALVKAFADQAVIAIGNARLFEEVRAKTRDLEESLAQQTATADVLKTISRSAFDLRVVYESLLRAAVDLLGANRGSVTVREGNELVVKAVFSSDPAFHGVVGRVVSPDRTTMPGRVLLSGVTELIADTRDDAEFLGPPGFPARSAIGVPLLLDGRVEGALSLAHALPDAFLPRHVQLLETFADQAVIAIGNTRLFEQVQARTRELSQSLDDLRKTQDRLVQSEKLASLGQLTAGIAHEIKNPLNFVNNFASLSRELLEELRETLAALPPAAKADADELMGLIDSNLEKVASHGKRADSIVKNMLLHSREGSGERARVSVNVMVEEALNLGYHGARAEKPGFNVTIEKALDLEAGDAELYLQEITRVLLNLISNSFYATAKRKLAEGPDYRPTLTVATRSLGDGVEIRIRDNGTGIPDDVRAKMFNPFFTTKPAGEGTGLGLSLSHDIVVKQHGGALEVETSPGAFTEFIITLPRGGAGT